MRVTAAEDAAGNQLAGAPVTWTFTTGRAAATTRPRALADPSLIIGNTAAATSQFSPHAEILRAEGINEFATTDLSQVSRARWPATTPCARGHTADRGPGDDVHHVGARAAAT